MKVLDLQCAHQHLFEGWFASEDDFQSQRSRGMVECPLCGNSTIAKRLSAPRLNLGASEPPANAPAPTATPPNAEQQARWLQLVRHVVANTDDVGEHFADEARRIHHGEVDARAIRGQATPAETAALRDEGIEVLPLPLPAALKGTLQ